MNTQRHPDLTITSKISGEFRCVLNEGTDREISTPWFDNLVLNSGLDRLGIRSGVPNVFLWLSIGTGTTAPTNTDTTLQAFVASVSAMTIDSQTNAGSTTYAGIAILHHVFAQGAVVGNMAEVGIGWASGGGSLFSRALIVDGGGSPTTLTVTSLDQLTVYYKVTHTPVVTDLTSTVTISGTSYGYTCRLAQAASFMNAMVNDFGTLGIAVPSVNNTIVYPSTSTLGALTSTPSGTATSPCTSVASAAYTNGNFYVDNTYTWGPTAGNSAGGIGGLLLSNANQTGQFQWNFPTPIPKDNTKTLTLIVRWAWSR